MAGTIVLPRSGGPTKRPVDTVYKFLRSLPTWLLWLVVVVWTMPTFSLFVNSFRSADNQRETGFWHVFTEGNLSLDGYTAQLTTQQNGGLKAGVINSFAIALPATIIPILFAAMAAYAFAWMDFRGRKGLFIGVVAMMAIPLQVALVPVLQTLEGGVHWTIPGFESTMTLFPELGLAGDHVSVWLAHIAFGMPFAVFLLHNHISSLPADLFEAARIDGADHVSIFMRLVLPLSVPALASFAIFQFLWTWNDYLVAVTMLGANGGEYPATIVIANQAGQFGGREHLLSAGAFIQSFVPLGVFFALQRYFVRGLLAGSVKG